MTTNKINHTHTTIQKRTNPLSAALLTGFLLTACTFSAAAANNRESCIKGEKISRDEASNFKLAMNSTTRNVATLATERPGKPDGHNSNGDDRPVRPPR